MKRVVLFVLIVFCCCLPALAQQTGSISGQVADTNGDALPGVTVTATGSVLPGERLAITRSDGRYVLRALPPGRYMLEFQLEGFKTTNRDTTVLLEQNTNVNVTLQLASIEEELVVTSEAPAIDTSSAEIKAAVPSEVIDALPVGQDYRDLVKLIPGVQYTEDGTRGPSAGGSGQDNVYKFDGVDVGLPLFGTLSAEPASYDIAQVSIVKGGAKAIDFNRSGGFTINSVSKSGTGEFRGEARYQIQTDGMTGDRDTGSNAEFERDRDWATFNFGGPAIIDKLYFYTSYYRPTIKVDNRSNLYGEVPNSKSDRDELFGKLTFTPTTSWLLNASYRDSSRDNSGFGVSGEATAGSAATSNDGEQTIAILEGSWIVNDKSFFSFKYTDYELLTSGSPDNLLNFNIASDGSVPLNIGALDQQGLVLVPQPIEGQDAYNTFIQPIIDQYGFQQNGILNGGGIVGVGSTINDQDFTREAFQLGFDTTIGKHELHFGYHVSDVTEDLSRTSNGWGVISVPGGRTTTADGTPIFYEVRFEQQSLFDANGEVIPPIASSYETQSIEINDTIRVGDWTFNIGVLLSNDQLFGQGLRENSANVSGFELAPGNTYKMYEVDWDEMISPRLGAVKSFDDGRSTVYASLATYYPAASSLPRAASWARNLRRSIRAFFDESGNLISTDPVRSSSGKFFQDGIKPRSIDEYIVGYSRQFNGGWTGKAHARYRYGQNFWEDTNNNARSRFAAPEGIPQEDYIPELGAYRAEVGGSSYVIAELDGAYTKYYEVGLEAEWRGSNAYLKGSYVWSHYYGNFDQDNTTTTNDANAFIGSSFIADGAGRQLWNFREGNLRGDRRHQVKVYGYYNFKWNASAGFYAVAQSGQPWEAWDVEIYREFTSSSSDTSRFAEPAGSRTTSSHYQVDLNYTQDFRIAQRFDIELRLDVFNVTDKQTGYNIQNKVNSAGFGTARSFFNPRRFQLAVGFRF